MEERIATTEDTYRVFEKKRFEIDRKIIEVQTGQSIPEDYSVDFVKTKDVPRSSEEINYWTWKFDQGLDNKENWFKYNNPDMSDEQIQELIEQNQPAEEEQPSLILY